MILFCFPIEQYLELRTGVGVMPEFFLWINRRNITKPTWNVERTRERLVNHDKTFEQATGTMILLVYVGSMVI